MNEEITKPQPLTIEEVHQACLVTDGRAGRIGKEIQEGIDFVRKHPRSVSFFGSARFSEKEPDYQKARILAKKIVEETGYTVVSGGALGIMEGANRGAKEAGGNSLGLNILLPDEQIINPYVTESFTFYYFFTRKVSLAFSAETYIFFPGGFGTLDEFFEILTLVQTGKIEKVPIILVGNKYWQPIDRIIREHLYEKYGTISKDDPNLYIITENESEIIDIIKKAPIRKEG
ncbi:TIGR00730 family Rossman fold protein [Candidatus Campbellbacteria bacterium CG11_big_fil_rev_8_21_14_0_20_44_21]|uniref:Cytokinin riboside 5'-monophosphate phosphoribohydrolase n=1 Tax=Candidatus Campbellbacteria bacterium CG22_combo_CG10-13_8_21_14_all_43_18 TaxID=1974530 RepID=A0A2H0DWV7_9BACT|nr:MAG: TIGR00730 family Rossman fold protein [Candidatus Campbellbacteria bacterium CG22_combo_CG10-13_8_21_14_all_43_18]PIR24482.1 MAG: TIGR00730 family Rossman fold protein [Candidatus Campbellbacteria bacterium CG11_big_fil_rev_8_21_14_0_20_44_21]